MRICVVGASFHPERVGIGVYTYDMCRFFAQAGHQVVVVTGFPFYPELQRFSGYEGRTYQTESLDGMTVHRCYVYVPRGWTTAARATHELSFALSALPRLIATHRPDVLLIVSPAFLPAVAFAILARARGIPVATHLQDLQPDAAVELGMLRSGILIGALRGAERLLYRNSALISTLNEEMRTRVVGKGVPEGKVVVFPNWLDAGVSSNLDGARLFRIQHSLGNRFLVVYSGSMGVKHGLQTIIEVAALAVNDPEVHFVLVGDGAARQELERDAASRNLRNVTFLPLQPIESHSDLVAASDISIIPQRPEVRNLVVPSKVLRILAGGSPIVASAHPESGLAHVVYEAGAGKVVSSGLPADVWEAISRLKQAPELRRQMGDRGRAYVLQNFGREGVLGGYLQHLRAIAEDRIPRSRDTKPGTANTQKRG